MKGELMTEHEGRAEICTVDLVAIAAKKQISVVEAMVDGGLDDAKHINEWLSLYDNHNTIALADKEIRRLFLWMRSNGVELSQFTSRSARAYLNNLANPRPRELWIGARCPKYLKCGALNPQWRPLAGPLSASSVKLSYSLCRSFFNYLDSGGILDGNPFSGLRIGQIKNCKSSVRTRSALSKSARDLITLSLKDLIVENSAKGMRLDWVYHFLMVTGLRRQECVDARIEHLSNDDGIIWLEVVGKGNVRGKVPIPDFLINMLIKYLNSNGLELKSLEQLLSSHRALPLIGAYLKPNEPITKEALWHCVRKVSEVALEYSVKKGAGAGVPEEIESMSTHWLRHTCASVQLNEMGLTVVQVRDNLRHANISTTSNYLSGDDNDRHRMVSKWGSHS